MTTIKPQAVMVLPICCAAASAAGPPEIFGTVGSLKRYLDEPATLAGGAGIRIPVWGRLGARAEFPISKGFYSNRNFLAGATYDFRDPQNAAAPYLIGGGGFVMEPRYRSGRGTFIGGAGVRLAIGDRITVSPEFRLGNTAFPLITVNFGFRLGRRR